VSVVISGVAIGLLYGLLGFAVVLLYKMTGILNFAEGSIATAGAFFVYTFAVRAHLGLEAGLALGLLVSAIFGLLIYIVVMRYRDDAGPLNVTVRTLGLYLLLLALLDQSLGPGQPFSFPAVFPVRDLVFGAGHVPEASLGILGIAVMLSILFGVFFRHTGTGLLLRGLATDRGTARLLGVNVRSLTALSWVLTTVLASVVGILTAPTALLSSDMMDNSLLYVFAAIVIGGLTSLGGAVIGGVVVGIVQGVVHSYGGADVSLVAVFALFLGVLLVRPDGLFGTKTVERL